MAYTEEQFRDFAEEKLAGPKSSIPWGPALGIGLPVGGFMAGFMRTKSGRRVWDYYFSFFQHAEEALPMGIGSTFRLSETISPLAAPDAFTLLAQDHPDLFKSRGFREYLSRITGSPIDELEKAGAFDRGIFWKKTGSYLGDLSIHEGPVLASNVAAVSTGPRRGGFVLEWLARITGTKDATFFKNLAKLEGEGDYFRPAWMPMAAKGSKGRLAGKYAYAIASSLLGRMNLLLQSPFDLEVMKDISRKVPLIGKLKLGVEPGTGAQMLWRYAKKAGLVLGAYHAARFADYVGRETGQLGTIPLGAVYGGAIGLAAGLKKGRVGKYVGMGAAVGAGLGLFGKGPISGVAELYARTRIFQASIAETTGLGEGARQVEDYFPGLTKPTTLVAAAGVGLLLGGARDWQERMSLTRAVSGSGKGQSQAGGKAAHSIYEMAGKAIEQRKKALFDMYGAQAAQQKGIQKLLSQIRQRFHGAMRGKQFAPAGAGRWAMAGLATYEALNVVGSLISGDIIGAGVQLAAGAGAAVAYAKKGGAAGLMALAAASILREKETPEHLERVYRGEELVPVKAGRWWEAGRCNTAESLIKTGVCETKRACDIQLDDQLLGSDGRLHDINGVYTRSCTEPVVYISTIVDRNIETGLTLNHIIPVIRPGYQYSQATKRIYWKCKDDAAVEEIQARDLKVGDFVQIPRPVLSNNEEIISLDDAVRTGRKLTQGSQVFAAQKNWATGSLQKCGKISLPRTIELSPELGRLIGYFLAEGNLSFKGNNPHMIETAHAVSEQWIVEDIRVICQTLFGITPTIRFRDSDPKTVEGCWIVRICSALLARVFFEWFYSSSRENDKRFPDFCFGGTKDFRRNVVLGYWRGDGHDDRGRKVISSCRPNFLDAVRTILLDLGFFPSSPKKEIASKQNKNGTFSVKYKIGWNEDLREKNQGFITRDGILFARVVGVREEIYSGKVFDFEIDHDDHLLQSGTFLVHNSPYTGGRPYFRPHRVAAMRTGAHEAALYGCLSPDTKVVLASGDLCPISEIQSGDRVVTQSGEVTEVIRTVEKPKEIVPGGGTLVEFSVSGNVEKVRATPDHKILVFPGDWKEARSMSKGDYVAIPKRKISDDVHHLDLAEYGVEAYFTDWYLYPKASSEYAEAYEAYEEEGIESPKIIRPYKGYVQRAIRRGNVFRYPRFVELNREFGYFVGLYLAEGFISHQANGDIAGVALSLHSKEESFVSRISEEVSRYANFPKVTFPSGQKLVCTIASRTFGEFIERFAGRADNKCIPEEVFRNKEFALGVIEGLIDGDGYVPGRDKKENIVSFCSVRRRLTYGLRQLIHSCGFGHCSLIYRNASCRDRNNRESFILKALGQTSRALRAFFGWGDPETRLMDRKNWFQDDNYIWVRITGVSTSFSENVYDIVLNHEDHSFQTSVCVVHNSEEAYWETDPVLHPVRWLMDPYAREKLMWEQGYKFPVSKTPFEDYPVIGPILATTIGRILKPPKFMGREEWLAERPTGPAPAGYEELPPPEPITRTGLKGTIGEQLYRTTELIGLPGFVAQAMKETITGEESFFPEDQWATPSIVSGTEPAWWSLEAGGAALLSEGARRYVPHRRSDVEYRNPLPSGLPSWLPGPQSEYFLDFSRADIYSKVKEPWLRLPGSGYATLNPELKGVDPELYPVHHRFRILANLAPWSKEYQQHNRMISQMEAEGRLTAEEILEINATRKAVAQMKRAKEFQQYKYDERSLKKVRVRVTGELEPGVYMTDTFGSAPITLAGVDSSGPSLANIAMRQDASLTSQEALQVGQSKRVDYADFLRQYVYPGAEVDVFVHRDPTGLMERGPSGQPQVRAVMSAGGINLNRALVERGLAESMAEGEALDPMMATGHIQRAFGSVWENLAHGAETPLEVFTPMAPVAKFVHQRSALEEWERSEVYARDVALWQKPISHFLAPGLSTTAWWAGWRGLPREVQEKYMVEEYFDRLEHMKWSRLERAAAARGEGDLAAEYAGQASRTRTGVDPFSFHNAYLALSTKERSYFKEFVESPTPEERRRISEVVSPQFRDILHAQWSKRAGEAVRMHAEAGLPVGDMASMNRFEATRQTGANMARERRIKEAMEQVPVPGPSWVGWQPEADMEDYKVKTILDRDMDTSNFGVWATDIRRASRRPWTHPIRNAISGRSVLSPSTARRRYSTIMGRPMGRESGIFSYGDNNGVMIDVNGYDRLHRYLRDPSIMQF